MGKAHSRPRVPSRVGSVGGVLRSGDGSVGDRRPGAYSWTQRHPAVGAGLGLTVDPPHTEGLGGHLGCRPHASNRGRLARLRSVLQPARHTGIFGVLPLVESHWRRLRFGRYFRRRGPGEPARFLRVLSPGGTCERSGADGDGRCLTGRRDQPFWMGTLSKPDDHAHGGWKLCDSIYLT